MAQLIAVKDLSYYYGAGAKGAVRALKKVNLAIRKGELVAVIGQNGSGKSTLAKHLNGLLQPTKGDVLVGGLSVKDKARIGEIRKKVGMVFQNPDNQLVSTVVEEDVAFGPENLGMPPAEIRKRVEWALETLHMLDFRKASPNQLSGGQKQRVAIAGVLAMKPECIVLDEPTALLDPLGRREVLESIKKLNREEGITIVYITHFMNEAIAFDRIVVMDDGQVNMDGPPREIFKQAAQLKLLGLDLPVPLQFALRLNEAGYTVPADTINVEELVQSICRLI
ncbi:MAG: energy-coupling factor transporter ATPase [Bacillota bacterium]